MKIVGTLIAASGLAVCLASNPAHPATVPEVRENLATRLIGRTVENQDATELGKIRDFILEADTGKPRYAVIASGGFAGVKPRRRLVATPALSLATAKRTVVYLEIPSQKWAKAPIYKKSDLAKLGKQEVMREVYDFYGIPSGGSPATPAKPGAGQLSQTGLEANVPGADVSMRRASEILGQPVLDSNREKLGSISDLLLDVSGVNPTMAIVSAKSLLKTSECFAVPLHSLKLSKENKFIAGATLASLEKATLLTERSWRQSASREAFYRCPAR